MYDYRSQQLCHYNTCLTKKTTVVVISCPGEQMDLINNALVLCLNLKSTHISYVMNVKYSVRLWLKNILKKIFCACLLLVKRPPYSHSTPHACRPFFYWRTDNRCGDYTDRKVNLDFKRQCLVNYLHNHWLHETLTSSHRRAKKTDKLHFKTS